MNIGQILIPIGSAIFIAAITSWVTVRLSLKRFYTEKWWERKAESYSDIIGALYDIYDNINNTLDRYDKEGVHLPEDVQEEIKNRSMEGYFKIYRFMSIGTFVISKEVYDELTGFRLELEKPIGKNYIWFLNKRSILLKQTISNISELAKKDLKVK